MPTYTIELKDMIDDYGPIDERKRDEYLCLNDYPIWDEAYRTLLNDKIVNHYYTREIGIESIPMWQFAMRRKMFEIMPYFNQLYDSTQIQFDPMKTVQITTVSNGTATQNTTENSNGTTSNEAQALNSSTQSSFPQNQLNANGNYASAAAEGETVSAGSGTANEDKTGEANTEQANETSVNGYQGLTSNMLMAYRATIINIDMMVIDAVEELFMLVWDNSDETLPPMRGMLQ